MIVAANPADFNRLGDDFKGRTVQGFSFYCSTLERADIEHADAFAATTQSDNENIVAATFDAMSSRRPASLRASITLVGEKFMSGWACTLLPLRRGACGLE